MFYITLSVISSTFFNSSILRIFIQTVIVTIIQKSHSLLVKLNLPVPLEIDTKIKRIILMFELDPYTSFWRAKKIWRNIIFLVVKTKPNQTKQSKNKPFWPYLHLHLLSVPTCFFLAHARLMFRDTVTLEDAVTVVSVMESSMQVRFLADIAALRDLSCWYVASSLHLWGGFYAIMESR